MVRTTISLDDRLAERVRQRAREQEMSLSAFIAKVLDDALKRGRGEAPPPAFRLVTVAGPGVFPGVDLDRPRDLLVAEDEATYSSRRSGP
jgi:hypothetical protein